MPSLGTMWQVLLLGLLPSFTAAAIATHEPPLLAPPTTTPTSAAPFRSAAPFFREAGREDGRPRRLQGALDADICDASLGAVLTNDVGTLHDDQADEIIDCTTGVCNQVRAPPAQFSDVDPCAACQADSGHNGYGDELHCGKTIQAPPGDTIELTFVHMALESKVVAVAAAGTSHVMCGLGPTKGALCFRAKPG